MIQNIYIFIFHNVYTFYNYIRFRYNIYNDYKVIELIFFESGDTLPYSYRPCFE